VDLTAEIKIFENVLWSTVWDLQCQGLLPGLSCFECMLSAVVPLDTNYTAAMVTKWSDSD